MIAVFQKELNAYFKGVMGYLFTAFVLLFAGIYTMAYNLSGAYANFEYVLSAISFIYLICVPIVTMRSLAEERRSRTDQLLYALPIRLSGVVLGKYLAMVCVLAVPVCVMALYPLILSQFGAVSFPAAYGALLGFFLLGACLLSVGLLISALTESQVAAAVITLVTLLLLYFCSSLASFLPASGQANLVILCVFAAALAWLLYALSRNVPVAVLFGLAGIGGLLIWYSTDAAAFSGLVGDLVSHLSVFDRFDPFVDGIFDIGAVVYYLSIIGVLLFFTVQAMEKRRWSE